MKQKNTNTSTKRKRPAKKLDNSETKCSPWLEEYLDCFSFKMKPITQAFIHRISQELVKWAEDDDIGALKVSSFYLKKGIPWETWNQWKKKYTEINHATKYATMVIGNRREIGGLTKKFESSIVSHTMPMYDPEWKQLAEWRASLKDDKAEEGGTKYIIVDKAPDTGIPPCKEKDK